MILPIKYLTLQSGVGMKEEVCTPIILNKKSPWYTHICKFYCDTTRTEKLSQKSSMEINRE